MANLLPLVATGVVVALVLAYTFRPLLKRLPGQPRPGLGSQESADERRRDELFAQRDALLVAIEDLDSDQATGKIEAAAYQTLRPRLVDQAVVVLKQIDDAFAARGAPPGVAAAVDGPDIPTEIERRIAGIRRELRDAVARPTPARRRSAWGVGVTVLAVLFAAVVLVTTQRARQAIGRPVALGAVPPAATAGLAIDTGDPRTLYYGYAGGVFVSRDGGRTWEPSPLAPEEITALGAAGGQQRAVLAAAGPGLYASRDQGASWEQLRAAPVQGPRVVAVSTAAPDLVYLVPAEGGLLRSDDAGTSWVTTAATVPPNPTGLAIVDELTLYAATSGEGVFATDDGGKSWSKANGFVTGLLPTLNVRGIAYDRNSGDSAVLAAGGRFTGALYLATDRGVFRSRDGGVAWEPLPLRVSTVAVAVDPQDSRIIYTVDDQGNVYKSVDKGVTWRGS